MARRWWTVCPPCGVRAVCRWWNASMPPRRTRRRPDRSDTGLPQLPPRRAAHRRLALEVGAVGEVGLQHAAGVVAQVGHAELIVGYDHEVQRFLARRGLRIGLHRIL